ncbi:transposase [Algivirga pacifica]|uniref:Transposase IS200-like domain-containing protein n=1 Tax=Algivirga pacifica TaxID=1162670 RepID=A0ABP9DPH3_9BACT
MGRKYKIHESDYPYFLTFTIVGWIDLFTRRCYADLMVESLQHCQENKGLKVGGWCIMSSHLHLILYTEDNQPLEGIIRDLKAYTAKEIWKTLNNNDQESRKRWISGMMKKEIEYSSRNSTFQVWMQHNHPI